MPHIRPARSTERATARARHPAAMQAIPKRFPLGRHRRLLLAPAYAVAQTLDL